MEVRNFGGGDHFRLWPLPTPLAQNFYGSYYGLPNFAKNRWNCVKIYFQSRVTAVWILRKLPFWGRISRQPLTQISKFFHQSIEHPQF